MAGYNKYPGLDDDLNFPPAIRQALADSPEIQAAIGENGGGGGPVEGMTILGILNPGQQPTKPGIWARRVQ